MSKKRLTQAQKHLSKGKDALQASDVVMAQVEAARAENLMQELTNQHSALIEALGRVKLDTLCTETKSLMQDIDNFTLHTEDEEKETHSAFDKLVRDINIAGQAQEGSN